MEQADIVPDLVCLSKGLTAGYMPMAVTVAREAVFEAFLGDSFDRALPHGHSFTANPLACAVALASLALFEEEKTLQRIARINRSHRAMMAELAARKDVTRLRLIGSILAFDVKDAGGYQSEESRALTRLVSRSRPQHQTARADGLSHAALLHHRRGAGPRLCRHRRRPRCARLRGAKRAIDDMPGDAAAETGVGGADRAAERAGRKRGVALARRNSADRLHAPEEGQRVRIGRRGAPRRPHPAAPEYRQARSATLRLRARHAIRRSFPARVRHRARGRQGRGTGAGVPGSRQGRRSQ